MVRIDITRKQHSRNFDRYPSDLTNAEWAVVAPLIPSARSGGRPHTTNMHEVLNAILYLAQGGITWRMLPKDLPPLSMAAQYASFIFK
ncbi:hypothetical protein MNBD_ALPHA12-2297 [hydrothermal vent metagenome]|uniref:Insertion element IS402-like domain-containing protein n=1 Tax=hydrothermal vent metagenome TaxID=652676 RepID=A0A3B0U9Q4_9ZZZZ